MCGIVGVVNLSAAGPVDAERLRRANDLMVHRGPDAGGVWTAPRVGLAARRLSIIDVTHGHQPMTNEDGTVHIVYNGEVYNHADLRAELKRYGHHFGSTCDTEVLIHAYEQWGADGAVRRLRGMFAFALWDSRSETLVLVRDRMGKKPLYTAEWGGRLYFASEIRALLACSNIDRQVNVAALGAYLEAGFLTAPHTMFKGVHKLPPAHYMVIRAGRSSLHRYWELSYETAATRHESEIVDQFRNLMQECVRLRLMSEVPLGALLSGGIDSTTVVAIMQGMLSRPVRTVSVGFEDARFDESALAASSAGRLGTDHHPIIFTGDSMDDYPAALAARGEPLADATFVAMYKLFQACREQGLTVVLTGEGADELLGGYHWHREDARLAPLLRLPHALRSMIASAPLERIRGDSGRRARLILRRAYPTVARRYMDWVGPDPSGNGSPLLSDEVRAGVASDPETDMLASWSELGAGLRDRSEFSQMLWLQSRTRMIDRINHNVDHMSMAHSVEARPVFLDHKLWEFCGSIPQRMKLRGLYLNRTEKYVLREATKGLVPEEVRGRKKKGLSVPAAQWLRRERLPEWAEVALSRAEIEDSGLFNPHAVTRLRREHQIEDSGRGMLLLGVLSVQMWRRLFISSPAP